MKRVPEGRKECRHEWRHFVEWLCEVPHCHPEKKIKKIDCLYNNNYTRGDLNSKLVRYSGHGDLFDVPY